MLNKFKSFLLQGDIVVVAIGLIVATAFSTLIKAFTDDVIKPLVTRAQGNNSIGLGVQLGHYPAHTLATEKAATFLNLGDLISAGIYFVIFMAVIYFVIVVPYKAVQARRGVTVFGDPAPAKSCPACLSSDLPLGATKCKYCGTEMAAQ